MPSPGEANGNKVPDLTGFRQQRTATVQLISVLNLYTSATSGDYAIR